MVLGAVAIFVYVGGEVSIGSFLVNYFKELLGMREAEAGTYVALYWGGAMIGRFFGSITLSGMTEHKKEKYLRRTCIRSCFSYCNVCYKRISKLMQHFHFPDLEKL